MVKFDKHNIIRLVRKLEEKIRFEQKYIDELDHQIGDGDHGSNMANAFSKMRELVVNEESDNIECVVHHMGEAFLISGGGMGPYLYGNGIRSASETLKGKKEIDINDFKRMIEITTDIIQKMGEVESGDKTMYDVIYQVNLEIKSNEGNNEDSIKLLERISHVAENTMISTKNIIAKKGRASLFGQKSIGHIDPGAYSMYLIFSTIFEFYKDERIVEFLQQSNSI